MIGKMNGEHWYLYITEPETRLTPPATPEHERVDADETQTKVLQLPEKMTELAVDNSSDESISDETLEILMTDLDVDNAKQFYLEHAEFIAGSNTQSFNQAKQRTMSALDSISEEEGPNVPDALGESGYEQVFEQELDEDDLNSNEEDVTQGHALGTVISDACGLSAVYPLTKYPEAKIDAYLFTPCGFSANGVVPQPRTDTTTNTKPTASSTHYFTVHVTPEPECSYASFETNVPTRLTGGDYASIVEQVVAIFKPGRFSSTLFEAKPTTEGDEGKRAKRMDAIKGYRRVDRIVHDLEGYDLVFRYYEAHTWAGGKPRLGEDKSRESD